MSRERVANGQRGERRAVQHLRSLGYRIVTRNWRCKIGELDVVAHDRDVLVFVEVRTRQSNRFGTALETISVAKQRQIARAAAAFMMSRRPQQCRFDVIGITADDIIHVKDAFRG